jgi:glutamine amidotransferase
MKSPVVTIIDYECGNLASLGRAFTQVGANVVIARSAKEAARAECLILPGVGSFPKAMAVLDHSGLSDVIREHARRGRSLLGICLGMQLLFEFSHEFSKTRGLAIIPGQVGKLGGQERSSNVFKLPHIGWQKATGVDRADGEYSIINNKEYYYFNHSFVARPAVLSDVRAISQYHHLDFCCLVGRGKTTGCQFHPEKSGLAGLGVIRNYLKTL